MRIALLSLILIVPVFGQITTGSLSGYVFDPSKRAIPNARVTLTDSARLFSRSAATDVTGFYRIEDLAPALYQVAASAAGFETSRPQSIQLEVNQQGRVDLNLALSGQEQSVTVRAQESAVPTESSDLGTVIDQQRAAGLPLNERDFLQLSLLTPGVFPAVQGSELAARDGFAMQANGAREDANNFLLDGVDNNDQDTNRYILQPSVDSIQEFKIATNSYSAEYGRNAGAQVNVITRSGTNEVHGFGYEYLRNRLLDSTNTFDPNGTAKLIRNQFGGGLGGPVVKNRTFFFVSFDGLRGLQGLSQYGTVPTIAERQGNLSALGAPIVDPFSGQPFPNNVIPQSRMSAYAADVVALFPMPTNSGVSGNFFGQPVENLSNTQVSARLDHQFGDHTQLALRYSYGHRNLFEPFTQESTELPGFGDYDYDRGHNAMISLQRNLGPRAVNSLLVGMNRAIRDIYQQNYRTNVDQLWGVSYLPTESRDFGYPFFSTAGFSNVGDVTEIPILRAENTYQVGDTLSVIRGAHAIKIGGEVRRIQQNGILDYYSRGSISFSGAISGSGISDLLLGFPTYSLQSESESPQTQRTTSTGVFIQDDWKVSRRLTLNLGLRYEYNSPPVDPTNRMSAFNLATGTITQVGTDGVSRSGIRPDFTDFAPRVGFAYSLNPTTVIRGGYGIYYDAGTLTVNSALYFNPPYFNIYLFTPTATSLLTMANPFPLNTGFAPPASLNTLDPNLTTAYIQSWNFNVQREVRGVGTFSLAYAGSKGTHLIRSLDLNQPYPGPGPISSRAPYPQYSNIFFVESGADSEYQSAQITFNRRLARGLSVLAAYTFSKSIDDTSAFLATTGDPNFPQNSHDYGAERGLSSFDMTHRAVIAYVYDLPFRNPVLRHLETAAIITAESGQPFTPILQFDNSNTGNTGGQFGSDRPNVVGNPSLPNPSAAEWFNTAAFAIPPQYTFGDAGRNILRGPGLATVDMSLSRRFQVGERASLLFQVQAFNALNRVNLNLPDLFADDPTTFGKIFSAKDPRQVQLAARFSF
jgi:Carboxypeptidase regulatory-like domain/TonB dependent receptor